MRRTILFCLGAVLVCQAACHADLLISGFQANINNRFYVGADKAFIGQPFDWSGVGQAADGTWATMISPTYFVSAAHYHPVAGDVVTFHEDNNPSGPMYQATVDSWYYQGTTNGTVADLWLGKLTAPIPAADHIADYPVLTLPNNSDYAGDLIYVNGKPNTVGLNNIDSIVTVQEPDAPAAPTKLTVAMQFDYNPAAGQGAEECYLEPGDSGGPDFVNVNGQLALVGLHYYNGGTPGPEDLGMISGSTFVPYYVNQMDANMVGESVTTIVPEPCTPALLAGGAVGLLRRRKR